MWVGLPRPTGKSTDSEVRRTYNFVGNGFVSRSLTCRGVFRQRLPANPRTSSTYDNVYARTAADSEKEKSFSRVVNRQAGGGLHSAKQLEKAYLPAGAGVFSLAAVVCFARNARRLFENSGLANAFM